MDEPTLYKNGCKKMRLHRFTGASEERMCILAYLHAEATLKFTCVKKNCRVASIRHMTILKIELQDAIYAGEADIELLKCHIMSKHICNLFNTINGVIVATINTQEKISVVADRGAEIVESSSEDQWRHAKGLEKPLFDIGYKGMSKEGLKQSV